MARLITFGGLSVRNGALINGVANPRSRLAILAVLAVSGDRGLRREKLTAMFWPDSDDERARSALRQAFFVLKRDLGGNEITLGVSDLKLNPDVLTADVTDFDTAIREERFTDAAALYAGPFLDGLFLRESPEFERWVEEQRARLSSEYGRALERAAAGASLIGNHHEAAQWWEKRARHDPLSGRVARQYMEALVMIGDRERAIRHATSYGELVNVELEADPDPEVLTLAAKLRQTTSTNSSDSTKTAGTVRPNDGPRVNRPAPAAVTAGARSSTWPRATLLALAATAILVVVTVSALRDSDPPAFHAKKVVVAGMINRTGDSTLDALGLLAADLVTEEIQRAGVTEIVDAATVAYVEGNRMTSAPAGDDAQSAVALASATRAGIVVTGHYYFENDSLAFVARVSDVVRNTLVGVTAPAQVDAADPISGLRVLRQRVAGIIAARLDQQLVDVLPAGSAPPSLAAYREYVDGLRSFQSQKFEQSLQHFRNAYAFDTTFVAPLMWQAFALGSLNRADDRREVIRQLGGHRAQLSEIERHALDYFEAQGDFLRQVRALQLASALAPGSIWTYNLGNRLNGIGRFDEAAEAFDQIDRTQGWLRSWVTFWRQYARALHNANSERELALLEEARAALPSEFHVRLQIDEDRALAKLGLWERLEPSVVSRQKNVADGSNGGMLTSIALEFRQRGDTMRANDVVARALEWFDKVPAQQNTYGHAFALYTAGRWAQAEVIFRRVASEDPANWPAVVHVGLSAARQGKRHAADSVLARVLAAGDSVNANEPMLPAGPLYAARIAAVLGDRDEAVRYIEMFNVRTGGRASRHVLHRDFEELADYAPYLRVTRR